MMSNKLGRGSSRDSSSSSSSSLGFMTGLVSNNSVGMTCQQSSISCKEPTKLNMLRRVNSR